MRWKSLVLILFLLSGPCAKGQESASPENLRAMLLRTEKSIELIRKQIAQNQSDPFLPDLYLQLGELLTEKASTLYYLYPEETGHTQNIQITNAERDAIETFQILIRDFPKFQKRPKAYYLLASAYQSIRDIPGFTKTVEKMIAEFPSSLESAKGRVLLGQYYLDQRYIDPAFKILLPLLQTPSAQERNMGRHRIAQLYLLQDKPRDALLLLEKIVLDKDFKDEVGESGKTSGLKREALIDSIRPYTSVYSQNADPLDYYSRLAPTDLLFLEVIEKLALRYVSIRKYGEAVGLLRTLGRRITDPQRVVNLYREVLPFIPIETRASIPADEMETAVKKYQEWITLYTVTDQIKKESSVFFEKQVRDLGTRNHELARAERIESKRRTHLIQAERYYRLYLAYFKESQHAPDLAADLADIYSRLGRPLESSDYYLRASDQEFGPTPHRKDLAANALAIAQKTQGSTFYERLRIRGTLIRAAGNYMALEPAKKNDPELNFTVLKARYEQSATSEVLEGFYDFMVKFPSSPRAIDAGELVLDYFNTRKDYAGLLAATDRIAKIKLSDKNFLARVSALRKNASVRKMDEDVVSGTGGDQAKSYLNKALSLNDVNLKNAAFERALASSRSEGDLPTYIKTAETLAAKETDLSKQASILMSLANEEIKLTKFYTALGRLKRISQNERFSSIDRMKAFEKEVELAVSLKNFALMRELTNRSSWSQLSEANRTRVRNEINELIKSPIASTNEFADLINQKPLETPRWRAVKNLESKYIEFLQSLLKTPRVVTSIPKAAEQMNALAKEYDALENGEDPHAEMVLAIRHGSLFESFGGFLNETAEKNPNNKATLLQKGNESLATAQGYRERCQLIARKTAAVTPANRYCLTKNRIALTELMSWPTNRALAAIASNRQDRINPESEKMLFSSNANADTLLQVASEYHTKRMPNHAVASAQLGIALYPDRERDFRAVLGCGLQSLGLLSEANENLNQASDYRGFAKSCQARMGDYLGK